MKNLLNEEINQIQYLFEYKRGVVISEQLDPEKRKEYGEKFRIAKDKGYMFEAMYFEYLSLEKDVEMIKKKIDQSKINEIDTEYQKNQPTSQTTASNTPQLPQVDKDNINKLGNIKQNLQAWLGGKPKDEPLPDFGVPNLFYGYGEDINRETAKSKARVDADGKAKEKGLVELSGGIEQAEILTQSGENFISRKIFYYAG
jgi:hypothetical protein